MYIMYELVMYIHINNIMYNMYVQQGKNTIICILLHHEVRFDLTPFVLSTVQRGVGGGSHNLLSPPSSTTMF